MSFHLKEKYGVREWCNRFIQYNVYDRANAKITAKHKQLTQQEKELNEVLAMVETMVEEGEEINLSEVINNINNPK